MRGKPQDEQALGCRESIPRFVCQGYRKFYRTKRMRVRYHAKEKGMIKAYIPERRKIRRIHGKYLAKFRYFYPRERRLDASEYEAMTLDISEAGVSLVTDKELKIGSHVLVKFLINKELGDTRARFRKCILLTGKVIYSLPEKDSIFRMGIYFGPPSSKSEMKFFDIICSPSPFSWEGRTHRFLKAALHI